MAEAPNGDLTAQWRTGPCSTDCGLCVAVCPFANGVFEPRPLNQVVFGSKECRETMRFHEDAGFFENAFVGYSEMHRSTSSSGGLLTWTLEQLFSRGEIDRVGVVVCEPDTDGGCRFVFKEVQTIEGVRQGAGSIYHQVEISGIVQFIMQNSGHRWAITGVPCLCAAIRQAMKRVPAIGRSVRYLFGLACGMYQNRFYTELLCDASGIHPRHANRIQYRIKARVGMASNYRFQVTAHNGQEGKTIEYQGLPYYLGRNAFFRVNACNYCRDVFAEAADACFMDAWLPEYQPHLQGASIVLVRNPNLLPLLDLKSDRAGLCLNQIGIERVITSQRGHVRRKRYLLDMRQGKHVDPVSGRRFSVSDRLAWLIQWRVQTRSKLVWASLAGHHGYQEFMRSVWDLRFLIFVGTIFSKTVARVFRLLKASQV